MSLLFSCSSFSSGIFFPHTQSKDHQEHGHCQRGADGRAVEAEIWEGEGEEQDPEEHGHLVGERAQPLEERWGAGLSYSSTDSLEKWNHAVQLFTFDPDSLTQWFHCRLQCHKRMLSLIPTIGKHQHTSLYRCNALTPRSDGAFVFVVSLPTACSLNGWLGLQCIMDNLL